MADGRWQSAVIEEEQQKGGRGAFDMKARAGRGMKQDLKSDGKSAKVEV